MRLIALCVFCVCAGSAACVPLRVHAAKRLLHRCTGTLWEGVIQNIPSCGAHGPCDKVGYIWNAPAGQLSLTNMLQCMLPHLGLWNKYAYHTQHMNACCRMEACDFRLKTEMCMHAIIECSQLAHDRVARTSFSVSTPSPSLSRRSNTSANADRAYAAWSAFVGDSLLPSLLRPPLLLLLLLGFCPGGELISYMGPPREPLVSACYPLLP